VLSDHDDARVALSPSRISEHYILLRTTVTTPRRERARGGGEPEGATTPRRIPACPERRELTTALRAHTHKHARTHGCNDRCARTARETSPRERLSRRAVSLCLSRSFCQNHMFASPLPSEREERASRNQEQSVTTFLGAPPPLCTCTTTVPTPAQTPPAHPVRRTQTSDARARTVATRLTRRRFHRDPSPSSSTFFFRSPTSSRYHPYRSRPFRRTNCFESPLP